MRAIFFIVKPASERASPLYSDFEIVQERAAVELAQLLQAFDKNAWAHMEYAGKVLDAAAFIKSAAADEFAFLGFGEEDVLRETVGFNFDNFFRACREYF